MLIFSVASATSWMGTRTARRRKKDRAPRSTARPAAMMPPTFVWLLIIAFIWGEMSWVMTMTPSTG
ncbi:hypothetical protein DSECCO2_523070 [anaerobic digester metagenome]